MTSNEQIQCNGVGLRAAVPTAAIFFLSPALRPPGVAWTRRLNGFTLVELLVVVVIISMLMALLLPAVMGARSQARIVECKNHQKQIAMAVLSYETAKKRLPGYANLVGGDIVSWVPVLFPFLSRNDLWEGVPTATPAVPGWRSGVGAAPYIDLLVCPDDVTATGTPQLSYVVNCGLYNDPTDLITMNIMSAPGVFRDYRGGSAGAISLSDITSPSQTVMLSERINQARVWNTAAPTYVRLPTPPLVNVGFLWPDPTVPDVINATLIGQNLVSAGGSNPLIAPLPAIHPSVVIVTFCDGHVAEIVEDTPCNLYIGAP